MDIVSYKDFLRMIHKDVRIPTKYELKGKCADGITAEQQKTLRKFGIGVTGLKYKGQATIVIGYAVERAKKHLATARQMKKMEESGIDMIHVRTFKEAKWILAGNDPEKYDLTILLTYSYGDTPERWITVTKSRTEARAQHQLLSDNEAKNFRFTIIE